MRRAWVAGVFSGLEDGRREAAAGGARLSGQGKGTWGYERAGAARLEMPYGGAGGGGVELQRRLALPSFAGVPKSRLPAGATSGGWVAPGWAAEDARRAAGGVAGGTAVWDWAAWREAIVGRVLLSAPTGSPGGQSALPAPVPLQVVATLLREAGGAGGSGALRVVLGERWADPELAAVRRRALLGYLTAGRGS